MNFFNILFLIESFKKLIKSEDDDNNELLNSYLSSFSVYVVGIFLFINE